MIMSIHLFLQEIKMQKKAPEKNNHIVVRVDDETKEAFMNKVKSEGKNASTLIMGFIQSYLQENSDDSYSSPDMTKIQSELEALKLTVYEIQSELLGKSAA